MEIGNSVNAGSGRVILRNATAARPIRLGAALAGELSLTDAELDLVTTSSVLEIGRDTAPASGLMTIGGALSPANAATLLLRSGAGISGLLPADIITVPNLALSAVGAINVNMAASIVAASTTSGDLTLISSGGFGIGTVDSVLGISCQAGQTITLDSGGAVTQTQALNAGAAGSLCPPGAPGPMR